MRTRNEFRNELEALLNKYSMENGSDTPDFILAEYLVRCLEAFNDTVGHREMWYGRKNPTFHHSSQVPIERPLEIGKEAGWADDPPTCCGGECGCDKDMD